MDGYLALLAGVFLAGIGGELFVRGTVGIARRALIPPGIVGATIAAFATSSPELSVSVNSALAGTPQIALGDALGSNVVNVALILALALLISGIDAPRDTIRRDFPVALLVPVLTGILFLDGLLSRFDGLLLLGIFLAWLLAAVREARRRQGDEPPAGDAPSGLLVAVFCVAGLASLVAAGQLIVSAAQDIALSFGISEFVIGATLVAVGTSVPELATTVIAKLRGHDEVGLGTILGSNLFNGLFIVAVAAIIHPIAVDPRNVAIPLAFGVAAVLLVYPPGDGAIRRWRGLLLLGLYVAYVVAAARYG